MFEGGQMKRNCKTCKKNNAQASRGCFDISEEKRNKKARHDFSMYGDPYFYVEGCPVWYYKRYSYIYRIYNLAKKSFLDWAKEPFFRRFVFETGETYNALKLEQIRKRNK